jgi:hypothetical protein
METRPSFGSRLYDLGLAYGRRTLLVLACVLVASPAALAQVDYRPTPPPSTWAANRSWFRDRAPIPFAADLYYPDGRTVFFNGDAMVPTGEYDGVTLYTDTTVAPYSVLLVPVTGRLLQPYRPTPANETASAMRLPHYSEGNPNPAEPWSPAPQEPLDRVGQAWPPEQARTPFHMETVRKPEDNEGIWLRFQGRRWHQVGEALPLDAARLVSVGDYQGFPVYADPHEPYIIYIPTRADLVAPFRRRIDR